jgi:hypothetical protein
MPIMAEQIDGLMERSGATAVIQEFQRRGAQLMQSLEGLAGAQDPAAVAIAVADDATYLRLVTDALSGASTNLDVAILDDALREVFLVPQPDCRQRSAADGPGNLQSRPVDRCRVSVRFNVLSIESGRWRTTRKSVDSLSLRRRSPLNARRTCV